MIKKIISLKTVVKFNFISSRNEGDGLPGAMANIMLEVEKSQTEIADGEKKPRPKQ